MARSFNAWRRTGTTVPRDQGMVVKTGETFIKGAPVVIDTNGLLTECAAGATAVSGVAMQRAFSGPGYDLSDSARTNALVQGANAKVAVVLADREQEFSGAGFSTGGTVAVTPAQTNIGEQYGIAKDANGNWYIDFDNTTDLCVQITDIFVDSKIFAFKFLEAVLVSP